VGSGEDQDSLYVILMNVDRQQAGEASRRLQDGLRNGGHAFETRLAVYPEDGQDSAALLRALSGE